MRALECAQAGDGVIAAEVGAVLVIDFVIALVGFLSRCGRWFAVYVISLTLLDRGKKTC